VVWKTRQNVDMAILRPKLFFLQKFFLRVWKLFLKFFNFTKPTIAGLRFLIFQFWISDLEKNIFLKNKILGNIFAKCTFWCNF